MGASYRYRKNRRKYLVTVQHNRERETKMVDTKGDAEALVREVTRLELNGVNVVDSMRRARLEREVVAPVESVTYPTLREALPAWIDAQERAGEIRGGTPAAYHSRVATWVLPHALADGRLLGDLPVNLVTREMLGAVILRVKEAGRSLAIIEGIRNPLRGFYANLIETKTLEGPNPGADLKFFVGKRAHRRAKGGAYQFFTTEEAPQLVGTCNAMVPRWHAFLLTGLLAGLRWGESAALYKADVDWKRSRLHVQRTYSEKANRISPCKDGDSRWVKASPALLAALRSHIDAVELEAGVKGWTPEQRQLVFPNTRGSITHHGQFIGDVWGPLLLKAGLPRRKYHSTRHTFATWLLEDGADVRWVQEQMGHASIEQTVGTYGHCVPERHEAATAALDRFLTV
jgi:integrase